MSARGGPTSSQASWRFSCASTGWGPGCWPEFVSWWFLVIGGGSQETFWWLTLPSSSFPLCWPLSSYESDNQLVPYNKDAAKTTSAHDAEELDTHDGLLKNYKSFHRLSGYQDREAMTSAYHELINLMLSQMPEDKNTHTHIRDPMGSEQNLGSLPAWAGW